METQSELQDWQKQILENFRTYGNLLGDTDEEIFELLPQQKEMLEKVLADDFYISDEKVREILDMVLELGFYYERDRKVLNIARKNYLMGKNWIKRSYR
mgnify:CR=1 FL=1|jgi:hypothetical protein